MSKLLKLAPLVATIAVISSPAAPHAMDRAGACLVTTSYGDVMGSNMGASCAFLSIPYAASTATTNRWKPPQPRASWAPAVLDATLPPSSCPLIQGTATPVGSEDCLRLNIWVTNPAPATPAPVIVWLHTGGFVAASANFGAHNGKTLAEETGVIVVAPNYRHGPLGFLAHSALEAEDPARPSTGNYGLLDQRAAIQWVRDNIAQFGGDPNNITIAGTSAGGQSVGLHMVSPGSIGLFHRAVIQSAYPTSAWSTSTEARVQGDAFAAALGCTDPTTVLACMRAATRDQVLLALPLAPQSIVETTRAYWEPIVDGVVIPDQPRTLFEQGEFANVPTIIGVNRDEGWGSFIRRSFPTGPTLAQYEQWVADEFGADGASILSRYPAANFPLPEDALARLLGDGQFVCEARRLATLIADGGLRGKGAHENHDTGKRVKSPVFLYSYEYELDDISLDHVIHGVETNIIFGNNYTAGGSIPVSHPLTAADLALHSQMAGYWTQFADSGDPNGAVSGWPKYRKNHESHIIFDTTITDDNNLGGRVCESLWSNFSFRSLLTGKPAWQ